MTPTLTIVIVSHDARTDLERCLDALAAHPPGVTHEIVVVDNASSDASASLVRSRFPGMRLIELADNVGYAAANNEAIRATDGDLILLLNGDTLVPTGAIDALVGILMARQDVAIVGPRLVDSSGRAELSTGAMIGPWAELRQKLLVRLHARRVGPVSRYVERRMRREHEPDWVSGACLLVRRADATAVGLLDERYFLYNEDVDFCAAVRRRGRRVLFTPAVEVVHVRGRSAAARPAEASRAYRRSQLAFYAKHHPGWLRLLTLYLRLTGKWPG